MTDLDKVEIRLGNWKRQLIDLTLRNRLLNYRSTKLSTIDVVDELPQQVFEHLTNGRRFEFDSKPELEPHGTDGGEDQRTVDPPSMASGQSLFIESDTNREDRHSDDRLQTPHESSLLDRKLTNLERKAKEAVEEQGVNLLALAIGMMEWTDADHSDRLMRAPILLVPSRLKRRSPAHPYRLEIGDDEPLANPALAEKLRQFGLDLPLLPDISEDLKVNDYFQAVERAIASKRDWRLTSDVALGLFSFQKYLMYRDLEAHEKHFKSHDVVKSICMVEDSAAGSEIPDAVAGADLDEAMGPWRTIQVMDADSSQQRAMMAVREGCNLVIEGPPGTGKSQTITNLIADSIAEGKTVLFVAEKMAALDVVKTRMDSVGLGPFCLELHSNKSSKTSFVKDLARALNADHPEAGNHTEELTQLRQLNGVLKGYVIALHSTRDPLGLSVFEPIEKLAEEEETPSLRLNVMQMSQVSAEDLRKGEQAVAEVVTCLDEVRDQSPSPGAYPIS
ncbi:MAG: DUF4011 domain-containing protein [Planctomycetota bacterium]